MSEHIYILTDGLNTKIGITTSLDTRISAYNTHNPNFYMYKVYDCEIEKAKKIESVVKTYFKDKLTGSGKEWFSVPPEEIDKIVSSFIIPVPYETISTAMHGIKMPNLAYELKEKIIDSLNKNNNCNNEKTYQLKEQLIELFAKTFNLGIPKHKLPNNIFDKDYLCVDINHCDKSNYEVKQTQRTSTIRFPHDDHVEYFFHLVELASGDYMAIATSKVSMPYLPKIEGKFSEILKFADSHGIYAFEYNDWSWHSPDNTALILYTQKTPVQERLKHWNGSFRKWVIERSKTLLQEGFAAGLSYDDLEKTIYDTCNDACFPLQVQSAESLYNDYIEPFTGVAFNDEDFPHFQQPSFEWLFEQWNKSKPCSAGLDPR